VKNADEPV
jgi:hypothetical protein